MVKSKIETYLGFCVRSGTITYGVDVIDTLRKKVFLLIADGEMGESSLKKIIKSQERLGCPLLIAKGGVLGAHLHKPTVKAVAIKEKNLASAILSVAESDPQFNLYSGGHN